MYKRNFLAGLGFGFASGMMLLGIFQEKTAETNGFGAWEVPSQGTFEGGICSLEGRVHAWPFLLHKNEGVKGSQLLGLSNGQ